MTKIEIAREIARLDYASTSGDMIEIDDLAEVAPVSHGIWVQAWVLVRDEDIDAYKQLSQLTKGT